MAASIDIPSSTCGVGEHPFPFASFLFPLSPSDSPSFPLSLWFPPRSLRFSFLSPCWWRRLALRCASPLSLPPSHRRFLILVSGIRYHLFPGDPLFSANASPTASCVSRWRPLLPTPETSSATIPSDSSPGPIEIPVISPLSSPFHMFLQKGKFGRETVRPSPHWSTPVHSLRNSYTWPLWSVVEVVFVVRKPRGLLSPWYFIVMLLINHCNLRFTYLTVYVLVACVLTLLIF